MKYFCGFLIVLFLLSAPLGARTEAGTQTPEEALAAMEDRDIMQIMAAAAAGSPVAQYILGRNALFGPEDSRDPEAAWFWIHNAADMNFPPAQFLMAYICAKGIWMEKNHESAQAWLALAASNGNAMAIRVRQGQSFDEVLRAYLPAKDQPAPRD